MSKKDDVGQKEVQKRVSEEQDQGFAGMVPDETPNTNYTVTGVTKGKKTPETDPTLDPQGQKK